MIDFVRFYHNASQLHQMLKIQIQDQQGKNYSSRELTQL
jgi:hypothetical protein